MIKLGVNTVLYQNHDLATAMQHIAWAGYDGMELSAIKGMCEHLDLEKWREQAPAIRAMAADNGLALLSMEVASLDEKRLIPAFDAAAELGVPVVNVGPGGRSGSREDLERQTDILARLAEEAGKRRVILCVKAHVGACIDNTPTTIHAMKKISSPWFGIDMDPSHIYRAGENPAEALPAVISRVRHIHIRDCKGRGPGPGEPRDQACGRGDIDLIGYVRAMVAGKYSGPVCLEIIGAGHYEMSRRDIIAAESCGYLKACLKSLGAR